MRRNRTSGWRTAGSLGVLLAFVAGVAVLTPVTAQEPQPAAKQEDDELEPDELARAIIAEEEERAERRRQEQLRTEPVERDW